MFRTFAEGPDVTARGENDKDKVASPSGSQMPKTISYSAERVIGHGSFGVVFLAKVCGLQRLFVTFVPWCSRLAGCGQVPYQLRIAEVALHCQRRQCSAQRIWVFFG